MAQPSYHFGRLEQANSQPRPSPSGLIGNSKIQFAILCRTTAVEAQGGRLPSRPTHRYGVSSHGCFSDGGVTNEYFYLSPAHCCSFQIQTKMVLEISIHIESNG